MVYKKNKTSTAKVVFGGAAVLGLTFWFVDALLDHYIFYQQASSFGDMLLFDIPSHEIYIRLTFISFCFISALIAWSYIRKQQSLRHQYENLSNSVPMGIFICDQQGKILYSNQSWKTAFGKIETNLDNWLDLVNKDDFAEIQENWQKSVDKCKKFETQLRMNPDCESKWAYIHTVPDMISKGKAVTFLGILEDITEQKEIQQKLTDLAKIPDESPNPVIRISDSGQILYANKASEAILNIWQTQANNQVPDYCKAIVSRALSTGEIISENIIAEDIAYELLFAPVGEFGYVNVFSHDISGREQAQNLQTTLAAIVRDSDDAIISKSLEGRVLTWNPAAEKMYGYKSNEIVGKNLSVLLPPDRPDEIQRILDRVKAGKNIDHFETVRRHKAGHNIEVSLTISPIHNNEGDIIGASAIARNITDRKTADREREKLLKELEFKNKELESIIYVSSHDLRSPLVNIDGFSQELLISCRELMNILKTDLANGVITRPGEVKNILQSEIPMSLDYIKNSAEKMGELISGLLSVSRLGRVRLKIRELDMNKLIDAVFSTMQTQIHQVNAKVEVDDLPSCKGDRGRVSQVFANLISNALKYTKEQEQCIIRITAAANGQQIVYCVEDNGIGIAEAHQGKIFDVFHRLDPLGTVVGQGIGLAIVRRILDRLNGHIWVESQQGKGSKFYVALPR